MATIDLQKLPKEITDKYSIKDNTFFATPKPDVKDLVQVEIGDSKDLTTFQPQVKIMRWDNECNVSYRLIDDEVKTESVSAVGDKIVWTKGDKEINLYDLKDGEGGYEFEVILKEKPKTNVIQFSLVDKDVDYFYQPPLTEEFQSGYSELFKKEIVVTETQVKDLDGNVLVERPENVVGSYVVYAKIPKTNWVGGKEYKTGQIGFIYRPKIIDFAGTEVWGELHIENGILSVTIPQDFLDKAVYPVNVDPNFGYETVGGTAQNRAADAYVGCTDTAPGNGVIDSISIYSGVNTGSFKGIMASWSNPGGAILANGVSGAQAAKSPQPDWTIATYSTKPSITSGVVYLIGCISDDAAWNSHYNGSIPGYIRHLDSTNSYTTPQDPNGTDNANTRGSIYATYTAGGGAAANPHMLSSSGVGS